MKERGMLFSAPMVRAILDGRNRQTRRVMAVQPPDESYEMATCISTTGNKRDEGRHHWLKRDGVHILDGAQPYFSKPFGDVGDRIWVKETWSADAPEIGYRADMSNRYFERDHPRYPELLRLYETQRGDWRSSMLMPRWASRITLEITNVRVERLQAISIADAMAEGVEEHNPNLRGLEPCLEWCYAYQDLWRSLYGTASWDANPWVWVYEFKRVTG